MGKVKSAVFLTLVTVLLAGLCFMCTVSFNYGGYKGFRSILSSTQKDALLGNDYAMGKETAGDYEDASGNTYVGGGYTVAYYPEGVLSADAYEEELEARKAVVEALGSEETDELADAQKAVEEYETGYAKKGSLYFKIGEYGAEEEEDRGVATATADGKGVEKVDVAFDAAFQAALSQMKTRLAELGFENARIDVRDGYSVEIFLPSVMDAKTQGGIFTTLGSLGALDLRYGADEESAEKISFAEDEDILDYVKSVNYVTNGSAHYVAVTFTAAGCETLKSWTENASGSTSLYFYVGDDVVIAVTVSEQFGEEDTIYIPGTPSFGNYTADMAKSTVYAISTAMHGEATDLSFSVGEVYLQKALFGDLALTLCYVAFGVLTLAMLAFFFVRYHALGFVQLYAFLIYLLPMILLVWGISFLHIGIETFLAVLFGAALLTISSIACFEAARKEYAQGKTMATSVKNGYKRCFWGIFDAHVVLALISFVTYFIAVGELATFAFTLGLAAVLSCLVTLAVGRFHWACMMTFAKDKGKFCNFKREELEDE